MARRKMDYASLFVLRSDGRYQASYYDEDGKRKYKYHRDPEALFYIMEELKVSQAEEPTFLEVAKQWEREKWDAIKPGTQACYEKGVKRAKEEMGEYPISKIDPYMIQAELNKLAAQGLSASTIKHQKVVYKLIFRYAIGSQKYGRWIKYNPAEQVSIPSNAKPKVTREAPEDDIVKAIQEKAGSAYWGEFAMFLLCTGMRRGEALAVRWGDIDFSGGTITCNKQIQYTSSTGTVVAPKTKAGIRTVPLLSPLSPYLKKPKGAKGTDYVFHGDDPSKPLPQSTYKRRWHHYCEDMGFIEKNTTGYRIGKNGHTYANTEEKNILTAHHFRHGYATILYEAGLDVYQAQKLLGHSDIETTTHIYTHLRNKKAKQGVDILREYTKDGL